MLKNYFKIAIRNILKQKFYSAINILGLSIGIIGSLFVIIYIKDELSYDKFHDDLDRMYRAVLSAKLGDQEVDGIYTCPPLARGMVEEIPEVAEATRFNAFDGLVVTYGDDSYTENSVAVADSNFFNFFTFQLIEGLADEVLKEPNSIVMADHIARKYFGDESAVGKIVTLNQDDSYQVTGVYEAFPANSHFHFEVLISVSDDSGMNSNQWTSNYLQTYFKIHEESTTEGIEEKLDEMVAVHAGPEFDQFMEGGFEQFLEGGGRYKYFFQPVADIHLHSHYDGELEPNGNITYVYIFSAIGLFIIVIACINFMNLSTARSAGRAKEVGMRKALGSVRRALIFQFLVESMVYAIIALIIALAGVYLLLPSFNLIAGKELTIQHLLMGDMIGYAVLITLFVGLLAGSYPAFYLTSFSPAQVMKSSTGGRTKGGWIRGSLVVLQFFISIVLMICTVIVYEQLQYSQNISLGFNKENVLVVANTDEMGEAFKNSLVENEGILSASYSNFVIPGTNNVTVFRTVETDEDHIMATYFADYDQAEVLDFRITDGRYFSRDFPTDSVAAVINEAAMDELGWDEALGRELLFVGTNNPLKLKVIGVMQDFNFESLRSEIMPLIILLRPEGGMMTIKYKMDPREAVDLVGGIYKEQSNNAPFEYTFLEDDFNALYEAEQKLSTLISVFTFLAIFIACLGLFGLAAFVAEQRTKEIGIRKAMGASVLGITALLSREFTKFVGIAFVISVPVAWYFMNEWLQGFVYRISLGAGIFIFSGILALVVALITVSYQSLRAAMANPVDSLRYE